jgi:hypothetical protein
MTTRTLNDVFISLLHAVSSGNGPHFVTWDDTQQWPKDVLATLVKGGILKTSRPLQSIACDGCENRCYVDVHRLTDTRNQGARVFILCDHPDRQEQMGGIEVPPERLQQWKVTPHQLATLVANLLSLNSTAQESRDPSNIRVGMLKTRQGRRWISLNISPLTVEVNTHRVPLEEVVFFDDDVLTVDKQRIEGLAYKRPGSRSTYSPSTQKQEDRKRQTEAMHQQWRDEYRRLRRQYRSSMRYTDSWIARRIAKMEIGQARSFETIRRQMKK